MQLLCTFYELRILTVPQDRTDSFIATSMERGRPFPLFRGPPSRVVLAHLPTCQLCALALHHQAETRRRALGGYWPAHGRFGARGLWWLATSTAHFGGISVPIFHAPAAVGASLGLVGAKSKASDTEIAMFRRLPMPACERTSPELQAYGTGTGGVAASRVR